MRHKRRYLKFAGVYPSTQQDGNTKVAGFLTSQQVETDIKALASTISCPNWSERQWNHWDSLPSDIRQLAQDVWEADYALRQHERDARAGIHYKLPKDLIALANRSAYGPTLEDL